MTSPGTAVVIQERSSASRIPSRSTKTDRNAVTRELAPNQVTGSGGNEG
jgi:hypothetical protein